MTMSIDSDSDVPRVESGNTELRGQQGFSEECCASAQDVDVHVSEGQRPVISGAASQRLSFEEEHRPTPAASERLSFDEEYRPTPLGVRFRSEWDGKWEEASERVSWYVYDWANSVYSSVCITLFIPLFLGAMAQRAAAGADGELKECEGSCSKLGCPLATSVCQGCVVGEGFFLWDGGSLSPLPKLTVNFLGPVESFTFATRVLSFSVLVQAITFITFGAMADYGSLRKTGLTLCTCIGCFSTLCFIFLGDPSDYLAAALLTIVSNTAFGLSIVYYNAYLPILVDEHPDVKSAAGTRHEQHVRDAISNYMSSVGFGVGYVGGFLMVLIGVAIQVGVGLVGGFLMLLIGVAIPIGLGNTAENGNLGDRVAICAGGLWWALWSVWTVRGLGEHKGKHLSATDKSGWLITKGWVSTVHTLRDVFSSRGGKMAYPETGKFLVAYFFYSDSYSTIGYLGVLVMQQQLCMPSFLVGVILIEVLLFAAVGSIAALKIQYAFNVQPKYMIAYSLSGYVFICLLGLVGLVPGSPVGLKNVWEGFVFGAIHGLMLGPVQSYSRTVFSDLVIPGKEAEFFALYEITDKGSSWLGPLAVGEIFRVTRSINLGFAYLFAMIILPAALLLSVDHRKGMLDVRNAAPAAAADVEREGGNEAERGREGGGVPLLAM